MHRATAIAIAASGVVGATLGVGLGLRPILHANPPRHAAGAGVSDLSEEDWNAIRSSLEQMAADGQGRLVFGLIRPHEQIAPESGSVPSLPPDMRITITKNGANPAEIVVERDGKKWNATEDTLSQLPPDIRGYVERAWGSVPAVQPEPASQADAAAGDGSSQAAAGAWESHVEARLRALSTQVDHILQSMEDLRRTTRGQDSSGKGAPK